MPFKVNRGYRYAIEDSQADVSEWVDDQERPDVVVCLRLMDAPTCFKPIDGCIGACTNCLAPVVYNPLGPLARVERVCLQCMSNSRLRLVKGESHEIQSR